MMRFEVLANLRNWNFNLTDNYKLNKEEARVCIKALEMLNDINIAMYEPGCDYQTRCEEVWKILEENER